MQETVFRKTVILARNLMGHGKGYCSPAWCLHQCLSLLGCVPLVGEASTNLVCKVTEENQYAKAESVPVDATVRNDVLVHCSHSLGMASVQ